MRVQGLRPLGEKICPSQGGLFWYLSLFSYCVSNGDTLDVRNLFMAITNFKILWIAMILVIGACRAGNGHLESPMTGSFCKERVASHEDSKRGDSCPVSGHCSCSHINVIHDKLVIEDLLPPTQQSTDYQLDRVSFYKEPIREIDYPPQLS